MILIALVTEEGVMGCSPKDIREARARFKNGRPVNLCALLLLDFAKLFARSDPGSLL